MPTVNQVLYFIVRNDLDSMTPGRVAAQVSHAAHKFAKSHIASSNQAVMSWEDQSNGCGTVCVLKHNDVEYIKKLIYTAQIDNMFAETYYDETYPIRDGSFTHYVAVTTCGYIFIDFNNSGHLSFYDLYLKNLETL